MAQLPPKVPNMTPNWSGFPHQRIVSMENMSPNTATPGSQNPTWMDDFLDFSSTKRGSHRRSSSDTVAFLDAPMVQSCRSMAAGGGGGAEMDRDEFDGFDDEQIMSMFVDDIPVGPASSNTSSPSDHNSINEDNQQQQGGTGGGGGQIQMMKQLKSEADEMQSSGDSEAQFANNAGADNNSSDKIFDPKRVKRILANRQSAQRSRVRKLQYISELERSVTSLQAEVSVLSPRVAYLDHQRLVLTVDNSTLQQRLAALAQDKIFKDAHQEALRREIERLRKVYQEQNHEKMENGTTSQQTPPSSDANASRKGDHQGHFPPPL